MQPQGQGRAVYRPKDGQMNKGGSSPKSSSSGAQAATATTEISTTSSAAAASGAAADGNMPIAASNPNRFELARNWSLLSSRELLSVQNFVDAKDSVNNWCVGQVIEENVD